ncbi:MAG: hypothetical protein KDA55_02245, partial [Planctomycetales bacterium]|nr:hypothetical protein [Planctomycetales bacterium]
SFPTRRSSDLTDDAILLASLPKVIDYERFHAQVCTVSEQSSIAYLTKFLDLHMALNTEARRCQCR